MVHEDLSDIVSFVDRGMELAERIGFQHATDCKLEPLVNLKPKAAALQTSALNFNTNVFRVLLPLGTPPYIIYWAKRAQLAECQGNFAIIGKPLPTEVLDAETQERCENETLRLHYSWIKSNLDRQESIPHAEIGGAINSIQGVIAHGSAVGKGLTAILANALINSWTALETLYADLWEDTLNAYPQQLSKLSGKAGGEKKEDKEQNKKIDLDLIHKHNFDLSTSMGTILKDRYTFSIFRDVKRAYRDAFAKDYPALEPAFSVEVDALEAARNLLVHRAGRIDDKFLARSSVATVLPGLNPGDELWVDGRMAAKFLDATISSGIHLIQTVDEWIAAH